VCADSSVGPGNDVVSWCSGIDFWRWP